MNTPKRIVLSRTAGWRLPPGAVSCARPHRYSNPFVMGEHMTRDQAVDGFERALAEGRLQFSEQEVRDKLAGRDLACWCRLDQRCHVDVLLAVANRRLSANLSRWSTEGAYRG